MKKKIYVLNGPNLNALGMREVGIYGSDTLDSINAEIAERAAARGLECVFFQSNSEGALIDEIQLAHREGDGIILNAGAYTHYSYALRDALGSVSTPCVEVHISDVSTREAFRHISVIAPACVAQVKGRGFAGYNDALDILLEGATERLGEGFEGRYAPGQVIVAGRDLIDE